MKTKIPYGYKIRKGLAVSDIEKTEKLKTFFKAYIEGDSIKKAAAFAGITHSPDCCRRMLTNPVYLGDDYYPPLLSPELMQEAAAEVRRRSLQYTKRNHKPVKKPIPVQTNFFIEKQELPGRTGGTKAGSETAPDESPVTVCENGTAFVRETDPTRYAAWLYGKIRIMEGSSYDSTDH